MFRKPACLFTAFALCLSLADAAQEKTFSLTAQPLYAVVPALEVTGEYALTQNAGAAAILGFGVPTAKDDVGDKLTIPMLRMGGQFLYYPVGSFRHGMQLGAQTLWIKVFPPEHKGVTVTGNGLMIGPIAGYKWAASFGLTFSAQAGWGFLFFKAHATDRNGQEVDGNSDSSGPTLNGNMGWSF